ncbi:MAG TPA: Calx-beta domain-containing protein [Verrucomicrobiae bacterium]|nr:Calx-beta domain-containing protein [Verrucomicrobiae bacterium]
MNSLKKLLTIAAIAGACFAQTSSQAQTLVYSQDFDLNTSNTLSTTNWLINVIGDGLSYADVYFDYSTVGIPAAPNSVGGSTRGLKIGAHLGVTSQFPAGVSISPANFGISDNFDMHFDLWLNYDASGQGSTECGGAGYGTAGTSAQVAGASIDSVLLGATTDGGSSADYRLYAPNAASSYQDAAHTITGDTNSPLVYAAGSRNNSAAYYTAKFPSQKVPDAQTNLFPRQANAVGPAGAIAFKWHDAELKKVGNVITYLVDGFLIATADNRDATGGGHPLGGTNICFLMFDISGPATDNGCHDVDGTNVLFTLIDNVRITNFPNVVTVQATQPNASESGPSTGTFTISRTAAGVPLTVFYTLSGTATNGVQYQTLSGSVNFAALDTSETVTVTPIDDGVASLPRTVVLTIQEGAGYIGAGSDQVTIADNDAPTVNALVNLPTAYERITNDFIDFQLQRLGSVASDVTVNFTYGGTAVAGTDFVPTASATIPAGQNYADVHVSPLDNGQVTGPKTVTITVTSGTGYSIGSIPSATGTIIDAENPPAPVLFADPLTAASDPNWKITYGSGDTNYNTDFEVDFGWDINNDPTGGLVGTIPPPPSGADHVLRVTCNKASNPGSAGGVNVYYTGMPLSGDYAVRFSMNLMEGSIAGNGTEGALFGIDHSGTQSNWWFGSGTPYNAPAFGSDGVWYYVAAQGLADSIGDFHEYTGLGGALPNTGWSRVQAKLETTFAGNFKHQVPYTSLDGNGAQTSGLPANSASTFGDASTWSDVEIKQIHNVVTMSINKTPIFTYVNTNTWTSGYLMLGYEDPYGGVGGISVGNPDGAVYYSDLRVVQLAPPSISQVGLGTSTISFSFTSTDGDDTPASFTVYSSADVAGPYAAVPTATITEGANGSFSVVAPQTGAMQYYEVRHN